MYNNILIAIYIVLFYFTSLPSFWSYSSAEQPAYWVLFFSLFLTVVQSAHISNQYFFSLNVSIINAKQSIQTAFMESISPKFKIRLLLEYIPQPEDSADWLVYFKFSVDTRISELSVPGKLLGMNVHDKKQW